MTTFVQRLTAFVQEKGDESAAARAIGVLPSQVNRWIKNETRPVGRNLIKVKRVLPGLTDEDVYPDKDSGEPVAEPDDAQDATAA